MNKIKNIASIGGDDRQKYTVSKLSEAGFNVDEVSVIDENISFYDAFLLPLPLTTDKKHINFTDIVIDDLIRALNNKTIIFAGKADDYVTKFCKNKGIILYDYYCRDEFALKNAEPTALGVLAFVINNTKKTFSKMKILIIGYGKCGRSIGKIFRGLGAEVTAVSRKYLTIAQAETDGIKGCLIKDSSNYVPTADIIINTVPVQQLNCDFIDMINKNAMVIDISSSPFGFDYDYAKLVGKKINLMPSIPGKYFPQSAGEIIADTILNIIEEEDLG